MSRIPAVSPDSARGVRRLALRREARRYGGVVPGITRIMLADLRLAVRVLALYNHLHLRRSSPFTRLQREMVSTVVNGAVGGAP